MKKLYKTKSWSVLSLQLQKNFTNYINEYLSLLLVIVLYGTYNDQLYISRNSDCIFNEISNKSYSTQATWNVDFFFILGISDIFILVFPKKLYMYSM